MKTLDWSSTRRIGKIVPLALAAVYLIWGSTYLAIRVAVRDFPPFMMTGIRFSIAGGVLYIFLRSRGAAAPNRTQWLAATLAGTLMLVLGNGGLTIAEQWVASGLSAVVIASVAIWAAFFAGFWGRWPGGLEWVGIVLGTAGVVILNLEADLRASPVGAFVLLFAAASFALGSVWSRRLPLPAGLMGSAAEMLTAGGMLLLISLARGEHMTRFPSMASLASIAYLIVFGAIIAYSSYVYLLQSVRPTLATSYAFVNPIVAVVLGSAMLGEHITRTEALAMAIILVGVTLVLIKRERVEIKTNLDLQIPSVKHRYREHACKTACARE
jgi:drug/metabolite transporter (DMT)-like permease